MTPENEANAAGPGCLTQVLIPASIMDTTALTEHLQGTFFVGLALTTSLLRRRLLISSQFPRLCLLGCGDGAEVHTWACSVCSTLIISTNHTIISFWGRYVNRGSGLCRRPGGGCQRRSEHATINVWINCGGMRGCTSTSFLSGSCGWSAEAQKSHDWWDNERGIYGKSWWGTLPRLFWKHQMKTSFLFPSLLFLLCSSLSEFDVLPLWPRSRGGFLSYFLFHCCQIVTQEFKRFTIIRTLVRNMLMQLFEHVLAFLFQDSSRPLIYFFTHNPQVLCLTLKRKSILERLQPENHGDAAAQLLDSYWGALFCSVLLFWTKMWILLQTPQTFVSTVLYWFSNTKPGRCCQVVRLCLSEVAW